MVAIVIPYYRITFFEATLRSLATQSDTRFKVYVGDDASPKSPDELLENYRGKFDFDYFRFEENLGSTSLVKQWERCLALVGDEEWVMILGDDDVLDIGCVEKLHFHLQEENAGNYNVIRFASYIIDAEGSLQSPLYIHPSTEKSTDFLLRKLNGQTRSSLGEYVFRKSVLDRTGFYDFPLAWHSDEMVILQCSDFGKIFSINDAAVYIRESDESISGKQNNMGLKKKATYLFCRKLIDTHSAHFNQIQRIKLLGRIEKYFYVNRKLSLFFKLCFWYVSKTGVINLTKFARRFLLHLAKDLKVNPRKKNHINQ